MMKSAGVLVDDGIKQHGTRTNGYLSREENAHPAKLTPASIDESVDSVSNHETACASVGKSS